MSVRRFIRSRAAARMVAVAFIVAFWTLVALALAPAEAGVC